METYASKKGSNTGDMPRTLLERRDNDIGCTLNSVPESDLKATSPQGQSEVRISNIYQDNGFSARDRLTTMTECHGNDVGCSLDCFPEWGYSGTCPERQTEERISNVYTNNGVNVGDRPTTAPNYHDNDMDHAFNFVPEFHPSAASPQGRTEVRIANPYTAPDQSLARIQRSKSRQKALEIRNSAKAAARSLKASEDHTGGNKVSRMFSQQIDHDNELFGLANYSDTIAANSLVRQAVGECLGKEKNAYTNDGRITRSRSSNNLSSHESRSLYLEKSSDIAKEDGSSKVRLKSTYTEGTSKPVNSSYTANQRVTRSKSGASKKPPLDNSLNCLEGFHLHNVSGGEVVPNCPDSSASVDKDENADNIAETEVISDGLLEAQAACSESNLDLDGPSVRFEASVSRPPVFGMFVKPKTLDFGDMEKCFNKISTPILEKGRPEKSAPQISTPVKSAESHDKITFPNTSGKSLVKQSPEPNVLDIKTDAWRFSSETCVEECVVHDEDVSKFNMSKNLTPVADKSNSVQEIQHSLVSDGPDTVLTSAGKGFDEKYTVQAQEVNCFPVFSFQVLNYDEHA